MFKDIIKTERLILRPFEMKDVNPTFEMEQNPIINQYTNDGGVKKYEEVEQLIQTLINVDYKENGFGRFAIVLKETSEFIGFCGLKLLQETNEVDLGYRLKVKYWGLGLATEASKASLEYGFNHLQLNKIVAFILPDNIKSKRVLEKLNFGFEEELLEEELLIRKYKLEKMDYKP